LFRFIEKSEHVNEHAARRGEETPAASAATVDACGLTCGRLEPLIAQHLRALAPAEVLEIQSDSNEAADGIRAWVGLTGHTLVNVETDQSTHRSRYLVRKKTPQKEIIDSFVANGGQIWACGACTKPRGTAEAHLIPGAKIVTAAMVVEAMVNGASTLGF
jgi:TusA-related sulfurtransferase